MGGGSKRARARDTEETRRKRTGGENEETPAGSSAASLTRQPVPSQGRICVRARLRLLARAPGLRGSMGPTLDHQSYSYLPCLLL